MNPKLIPRKHRKQVFELINEFKSGLGKHDHLFMDWDEFLRFKEIGISDGWLTSNNKEYQALKWLIGINDLIYELDTHVLEEPE